MDGVQAPKGAGIERALAKFEGSPSKLAAAIDGGVRVTRQHVEHWRKTGRVPADKAPDVERVSGVPVEELCPGVAWHVLRSASQAQNRDPMGSQPAGAAQPVAAGEG